MAGPMETNDIIKRRCDLFSAEFKKLERALESDTIFPIVEELFSETQLLRDIEAQVKDVDFFRTKRWDHVVQLGLYRFLVAVTTRAIAPSVFIETGVLHGLTTNFTLWALEKNSSGSLISIDAPSYFGENPANVDGIQDSLPPGKEPGWVIAEKYRSRWQLEVGTSLERLPKLIEKTGTIDMFLHDSDHTYETMQFEMETAWPALRPGGVLICDNIDMNTAFFDFCNMVGIAPFVFPEVDEKNPSVQPVRFGLVVKKD